MDPFTYFMPTRVVFRNGAIDDLAHHARTLGSKAYVVTGRHSSRKNGALDKTLSQLPTAEVLDEVDENPTTEFCEGAAERCNRAGCDFVVALGGGSPMDAAKAIAGLVVNGGRAIDYIGSDMFSRGNLPVIAIPTTAGTGSETTPYAVLVNPSENTKRTIGGRGLFPVVSILDPMLTVSLPRHVTVNTGLDALSQGLEGMVSRRSTAVGDMMALEICRLVCRWLPIAAEEPENLEARAAMMYAAMLSGCVIAQSGTTLVHGMGYYYTMEFGVAHGLANALLLAPVFAYNARYLPEKVAALAEAMGRPAPPEPKPAANAVVSALRSLLGRLDVSPAAKEHGVDSARIPWCADSISADRSRFKNQIGEPTREEVLEFFHQSHDGAV